MSYPDLHEIPLASIEVGNDRARDLDPAWAEALSALIAAQGQLQPIIVRPVEGAFRKYSLVAGLHRLEGVRLLGRETIPAYLSAAESDDAARLEEVMENLGRYDLIALDRCHHLYELKQIHERKYPQAKHGGDRKSIKRQSLPLDPDAPEVFGFSEAVAEKVGLSARMIRLAVSIWTGLTLETRRRLVGTKLAAKQTELKALSGESPARQSRILDLILGDEHSEIENVAAALAYIENGIQPTALEKRFRALSDGLKSLPEGSFDLLLIENEDRILASLKRRGRI